MSRQLPANPNLEHLKNQAKDRLDDLRGRDPSAKLADAQHAIAREYGFVNWAALKAHVESTPVEHLFAGTWIAHLDASTPHPQNKFRSATLRFEMSGDSVTILSVMVDQSGREERGQNTVQVDGRERELGPGLVVRARWTSPRAFETVATREGRVIGQGTYEVSADRKTLTISTRNARQNADGWQSDAEQVIVLKKRPLATSQSPGS
jgi:hypothetical protein